MKYNITIEYIDENNNHQEMVLNNVSSYEIKINSDKFYFMDDTSKISFTEGEVVSCRISKIQDGVTSPVSNYINYDRKYKEGGK